MAMEIVQQSVRLINDPKQTRWISPLLLLADAALCALVVWKIPYTEIDWRAYMEQISLVIKGERDYVNITGGTGPLVYPGTHVWIYRVLYSLTDSGRDIAIAQYVFVALYLASLWTVMRCYRAADVPPWVFPMLVLSKRLHSIFILRLFNDCFAVLGLWAAIWAWQRRQWTVGSLIFSLGVGVKMSLLLALPAVAVVLLLATGRDRALLQAATMAQVQMLVGWPFISTNARSYFSRAFELTRQFLFKWTVNWRFVGEEIFLSRSFSIALLLAHVSLLGTFLVTRWLHMPIPDAVRQLLQPPSQQEQSKIARLVTPDFVLTTILTAVVIGCLCARSLHYQFYGYIFWATPFLLWRSGLHPVLVYGVWGVQEWAWNVYPSTDMSSLVVVTCLIRIVSSIWSGTAPAEERSSDREMSKPEAGHEHAE